MRYPDSLVKSISFFSLLAELFMTYIFVHFVNPKAGGVTMKQTDKDKPIPAIPKGVWEASRPEQKEKSPSSPQTDLQGNGYPQKKTPRT